MRKVMQRLNDCLAGFITQRENIALVLRCGMAESPVVLRAIQGIDEASTSDLFWVFPDNFVDSASYATAIYSAFKAQHEEVRTLQGRQGLPVWPAMPVALGGSALTPVERLRGLMSFSRSLLPTQDGGMAVWALLPLEISNPAGWASFYAELLKHQWPFPWCHHLRFFIRDAASSLSAASHAVKPPRIAFETVDLGPDVIARGLVEDAEDESLPLAARMNTVLMLGGMDQSHRRFDAALKKYDLVLRYAMNANVPQLACAALNQMGETFRDKGEKERAALFFGAALESGGAIGPVAAGPALLNAMINAGNLAQSAERWADAEIFFQGATLLAGLQSDPKLRLHCMDRRGVALYKQNKPDEALAAWMEMEKSAKGGAQADMQLLALQRFREHYLLTHNRVGLVETDRHIAELEAQNSRPA